MKGSAVRRGGWGDQERGSGTVLGLAAIGVIITTLIALLMVGAAVIARQQAQGAADVGAVAGAQALKAGGSTNVVCARAKRFVEANGAQVQECAVSVSASPNAGPQVRLQVSRGVAVGPANWVARVTANAGLVPEGQ